MARPMVMVNGNNYNFYILTVPWLQIFLKEYQKQSSKTLKYKIYRNYITFLGDKNEVIICSTILHNVEGCKAPFLITIFFSNNYQLQTYHRGT